MAPSDRAIGITSWAASALHGGIPHVAQAPAHRINPRAHRTRRPRRLPSGNPYLILRDQLGTFYEDQRFTGLFSTRGQPAKSPWRLALVTVLQYAEGLADRQAADAVRSRIDWKYLLGLELDDPGIDFSVLCEFRSRLMLVTCKAARSGSNQAKTQPVLAAIRASNRLELVGETLRRRLQLATVATVVAVGGPDGVVRSLLGPGRGSRCPGEGGPLRPREVIGGDGYSSWTPWDGPRPAVAVAGPGRRGPASGLAPATTSRTSG